MLKMTLKQENQTNNQPQKLRFQFLIRNYQLLWEFAGKHNYATLKQDWNIYKKMEPMLDNKAFFIFF